MKSLLYIIAAIVIAVASLSLIRGDVAIWVGVVTLWYVLGFQIIRENERGVMVLLGDPLNVVNSGLRWAPFLIGKFLRYPTGIVELNFKRAGIITRKGKLPANTDGSQEDRVFGTANVGADTSFRFRWPHKSEDLINCVKLLPSPDNTSALISIFEEPILDHVRNAGGKKVWVELARDRKGFAEEVRKSFLEHVQSAHDSDKADTGNIIVDSKIEDPIVAIAHLEIPPELLNSLTAEEIAQQEKSADIIRAEGEKQKLVLEGKGKAEARELFIQAIGKQPEGIRIQSLLTLEAMAQGNATTIFPIPTNLMDQLSDVFGKSKGLDPKQFLNMLDRKQKQELLQMLTQALAPEQAKPPRRRQP